jgi:hypothetical protein
MMAMVGMLCRTSLPYRPKQRGNGDPTHITGFKYPVPSVLHQILLVIELSVSRAPVRALQEAQAISVPALSSLLRMDLNDAPSGFVPL